MPDAPPAPPTAAPARGPEPTVAAAPSRRSRWTVRTTAVLALVGVVVALVGLGLAARPLRTPTQDCGTAFSFLVGGKVQEFVDPADPPAGVTRAEAEANNADPCQERAANRARPAGLLVIGGTLLALVALVAESVFRTLVLRRNRRRGLASVAARPATAPPPPPPTAPPPPA